MTDPESKGKTGKAGDTPLIFELSRPGRKAFQVAPLDVPEVNPANLIPEKFLRKKSPMIPEVDETQIVRHFTNLSKKNFGVDDVFYPLGSCTMKYNPKINEKACSLPGLSKVHPYQPEKSVQGMIQILYELQTFLEDIAGLPGVSLMPAAGAHGELTSLMVIKAYHESTGRKPSKILVPDVAHGTNPASSTLCGYQVVTVKSGPSGTLDLSDLDAKLSEDVAAIMITNPNTLGIFESDIREVCKKVHKVGGLVYMDGANMNALLGIARPGDFGIDVMHFNLHKTFSTPHGGGGPGSGPIAVAARLKDFLPGELAVKEGDSYKLRKMPSSIGRTKGFFGNCGIMVRAYAYIMAMGGENLAQVGRMAILNANYLKQELKKHYHLAYDRPCMHEFVLSASIQKQKDVRALDIAKRLLEMRVHPPTIYFPLTVPEAMMIEPTETENKETLDRFCNIMVQIAGEAKETPEIFHEAPRNMPVRRLDEVNAARNPVLRWVP